MRARFAAGQELVKEDLSPVTVADLGVQALAVLYLRGKAPHQEFVAEAPCKHAEETLHVQKQSLAQVGPLRLVGEEDSKTLDGEAAMLRQVTALVNEHFPFAEARRKMKNGAPPVWDLRKLD